MCSLLPIVLKAGALPSAPLPSAPSRARSHPCPHPTLSLGPSPQTAQTRVTGRETKGTARGRMNPTAPSVPKTVLPCLSLGFPVETASKTPSRPGARRAGHLAPGPAPQAWATGHVKSEPFREYFFF